MKKILIIGSSLVGAGLVILALAFFLMGGDIRKADSGGPFEKKEVRFQTTQVKKLLVAVNTEDVEVVGSDTEEIKLTYEENKKYQYNVEVSDSTLIVKPKHRGWNFLFLVNFDFGVFEDHPLILEVPRKFLESVDIQSHTGDVLVKDIEIATSSALKSNTGEIEVENVTAKTLEADSDTGRIQLEKVSLTGDLTATGHTGEIELEQVQAQSILLKSNTGDLGFENVNIARELKAKTNTGDIHGNLFGKRADYTIRADASLGRSNVSNQTGGDKTLELETNTGSITVDFGEERDN